MPPSYLLPWDCGAVWIVYSIHGAAEKFLKEFKKFFQLSGVDILKSFFGKWLSGLALCGNFMI